MTDKEPEAKAPAKEARDAGDVEMRIIPQPWQESIVVGDVVVGVDPSPVPSDQVQAVYEHAANVGVLVEEVVVE